MTRFPDSGRSFPGNPGRNQGLAAVLELGDNQAMYFLPDDERWIRRKTGEIVRQTVEPWPIARSEAMREFKWMQRRPKATVTAIHQGRLISIRNPN